MNSEQENPQLPEGESQEKRRGGPRPGAGRPVGSLKEENKIRLQLKRRWVELINRNADTIFETHLLNALGVFYENVGTDGTVRIYKTKPNAMSLEWMMEHIWGRAPQKMILEGSIETQQALTPEMQKLIENAMNYALPNSVIESRAGVQDATDAASVSGEASSPTGQSGVDSADKQ